VGSEIEELRQLVREQGERIRALEARVAPTPSATPQPTVDPTRRQLFRLAGAAAAGGVAAGLGGGALTATPAAAADGDNLVLGEENEADSVTLLSHTKPPGDQPLSGTTLVVTAKGVEANGFLMALAAEADFTDISGSPNVIRQAVGVGGLAREGTGVQGDGVFGVVGNGTAVGLVGEGPIGASLRGERADLFLFDGVRVRNNAVGHLRGEIWRDNPGAVWLCIEPGGAGQTGTWQKLGGPTTAGQLHMLSPSVRAYDSRAGEQPLDVTKGKLSNSAERVIDAQHGGAVPASANGGTPTAALVNLTITDTTSTGGYLGLFQNGTTWPGNSSINWDAVGRATADTTVVALDDQGRFKVRASPGGGTDFVIDVMGYWL
jgi:hypothetical protein